MGRTPTDGLTYFNIDCAQEDSLNFIEAKHGITGYGIWVKLLRKIYMIKGYYCEWSEKNIFLFSKEVGVEVDVINRIIDTCLAEGLFHAGMLKEHGILTSAGIQKRWIRIVVEAKRKSCKIVEKYALLGNTPEEKPKTPEDIPKTPEEKPQRKEKEKKEKKNTTVGTPAVPATPAGSKGDEESEPYWQKLVQAWFDFGQAKFGEPPSFKRDDPKILKRILTLLKKRATAKKIEWTEEEALSRFNRFLSAGYEEEWLSEHFLLSNLEKQFDVIIQKQRPAKQTVTAQTNLQFLYERYCEGADVYRLLSEEHVRTIPNLSWQDLRPAAIQRRISNLVGSNQAKDLRLMEAYQQGKETPETREDVKVIETMAKKQAMLQYFALNKHNQVKTLQL